MAIRQIDGMHREPLVGRLIQRKGRQVSCAQIVGNNERRLVDDALSGDGRGQQRVAIVGAQVARYGNADLGLPAERPPIGAGLRQRIAEAIVRRQFCDRARRAPQLQVRRRCARDHSATRDPARNQA